MQTLRLSKPLIIESYCLARQAQRSVDAVLPAYSVVRHLPANDAERCVDAAWSKLTAYYEGERIATVPRVFDNLRRLLQVAGSNRRYVKAGDMLGSA